MDVDEDQRFLEALTDPALLVNARREVVVANRLARSVFDAQPNGRDLALSFRHPNVLAAVDRVLSGARTSQTVLEQAAPPQRVFEVHVAALSGAPTDNTFALCILRDVTAAREAERMRADFVANVSHELRSPLTSLMGFIETLKGPAKGDDGALARFLDIMEVEASRMARLIDDLLSLSRIEAREHLPPTDLIDPRQLLCDIVATIAPRAAEKGIPIRLEMGPGAVHIQGDRDELVEVFHNLIDNAVKYGRAGEAVVIAMATEIRIPNTGGLGVSISTTNSGDLIDPEHLPRLTERFYRIDKGRSRDNGGTGLGLAIVKHIVSRHRGQFVIESTKETGNTFTVHLPLPPQTDMASSPS